MLSRMWYDWDMFDDIVRQAFDSVAVRSRRNDDAVGLEFDLPGVREEDIEVTAENGVLTVRGERNGRTLLRSVTIPRTVDIDKSEAKYENGVLQIALPLAESAKPRRIELSGSKHKAIE